MLCTLEHKTDELVRKLMTFIFSLPSVNNNRFKSLFLPGRFVRFNRYFMKIRTGGGSGVKLPFV